MVTELMEAASYMKNKMGSGAVTYQPLNIQTAIRIGGAL